MPQNAAAIPSSDTPDAVTRKLADAFETALSSPEDKAYQASRPAQPMLMKAEVLGEFHLREYERFKRVAEDAGVQPQ